jgi:hypothetical protein
MDTRHYPLCFAAAEANHLDKKFDDAGATRPCPDARADGVAVYQSNYVTHSISNTVHGSCSFSQ